MAALIAPLAGYPGVTPDLLNFCTGVANHILAAGQVFYSGPPPAPPVLPPSLAWFLGGTISGLSGSAMADLVKTTMGKPSVTSELLNQCTAIANHIMTNATVVSGVIS